MKIHELTDEQCSKIAAIRPIWMAENRPDLLAKYCPDFVFPEVPEEIMDILK